MDYLWTPWRYGYVSGAGDSAAERPACVFCAALEPGRSDEEALIVQRAESCFVILNRYPYTSGHAMVVPYAHAASLGGVPAATAEEMMRLARRVEAILGELYRPDGVNLGMNIGRAAGAGVAGHIHLHVLPRWFADASFLSTVAETRALPESLAVTWERFRAAFDRPRGA